MTQRTPKAPKPRGALAMMLAAALTVALSASAVAAQASAPAQPTGPEATTPTDIEPAANAPAVDLSGDIRDVHDVNADGRTAVPVALIAGGIVAMGAFIVAAVILARRRARRTRSPRQVALRALRDAELIANEATAREFCAAVSSAIRTYVDAAFGIRAPRRTTEELLRELIDDPGARFSAQRARLEELLWYCDLAKFAHLELSRVRLIAMREAAEAFVEETSAPPPRPRTSSVPVEAAS